MGSARPPNLSAATRLAAALAVLFFAWAAPSASAQTAGPAQSSAPAIEKLTGTMLPRLNESPRFLKLLRVEIAPGEEPPAPRAPGMVYVISGELTINVGEQPATLKAGEATVVMSGAAGTLAAEGAAPAVFLHVLLLRQNQLDQAPYAAAQAKELFRTLEPLPGLRRGPYEFTLARVTLPPRAALDAARHRTGAALEIVLSGTGLFLSAGSPVPRTPGTVQYEPYGVVYQWANPGAEPLALLAATLNPDGVPPELPGAPAP